MVLQPRRFKFKHRQKLRKTNSFFSNTKLRYGQVGLVLVQVLRLNSKRIFRIKLFLKKASRRGDLTRRGILVNAFPHLPITKKPAGSRMGKGKGRLSIWYVELPVGHVFIELKNLRRGRAFHFLRQSSLRLNSLTKLKLISSNLIQTNSFFGKGRIPYQSFW